MADQKETGETSEGRGGGPIRSACFFFLGVGATFMVEQGFDYLWKEVPKRASPPKTQLIPSTTNLCEFGDVGQILSLAGFDIHTDTEAARAAWTTYVCLGDGVREERTAVDLLTKLAQRYPDCFRFEPEVAPRNEDGLAEGSTGGRLSITTDAPPEKNALCGLPVRKKSKENDAEFNLGSTWILCLHPGVG
jgi:hypothetical protein